MTYSIPSYSDQDSLDIFTEVCQLSTGEALPAFILFSSNADGTSAELSIDPSFYILYRRIPDKFQSN